MFDKAACIKDRNRMLEAVVMKTDIEAFYVFHQKHNRKFFDEVRWSFGKKQIVAVCCRAVLILSKSFVFSQELKDRAKARLEKLSE